MKLDNVSSVFINKDLTIHNYKRQTLVLPPWWVHDGELSQS